MKQVDFLFFDAGGGHRAAATALKTVIEQQGRPWKIRLVNLQEVLDELDIFRKLTGLRLQDVYNLLLRNGWTLGSPQLTVLMHWLIRLYHPSQVRLLKEFWAKTEPGLVVSLIPNFGRAVHQGLRAVHPRTPLVTVLTDLADYPPHFWIEPGQDQYYVCGTGKAYEQAIGMGYSSGRVFRTSGLILDPRFYADAGLNRETERKKLGLEPCLPTGLILFGGQGSRVMRPILERLEASGLGAQFIAICGKNDTLRAELAARRWRMPVFVEGFTTEAPSYMRLCDFFIGKPGPGSISEALAMRLPVIVERNAWTLPQERYNAKWIHEKEVGLVAANFRTIAASVARLLDNLDHYRRNTEKLHNRALFEIPPILEKVMEQERWNESG
ncbi:MAG: galactosyldiacylglycerol synthase [Acidobacteria bacterium]|nr:galactosyldiacylglycerol synthase [Acidobacteriota bacterium]